MRLEFEPNVTAIPLVENELFEEDAFSPSHEFDSLLKNGISAAQSGDRRHARVLLTEAAGKNPRSEDAWMWLASISDYPEELLAFLKNVLHINPENARAAEWLAATNSLLATTFVQRAVAANEEGSKERAQQFLTEALEHDNNCEMAWFWKASLDDSDERKLVFLSRVLEINPDNHRAGSVVSSINRSRTQAAFDEAKAAAVAGDRQRATDLVDEYLQNVPNSVEAWTLKSHLSLSVDQKMEALEKALEIDPENAAARSGLAFLALTFGSAKQHAEPDHQHVAEPETNNLEVETRDGESFAPTHDSSESNVTEPAKPNEVELADFASAPTDEHISDDSMPADHVSDDLIKAPLSATEEVAVEHSAFDAPEPAADQFHGTTYYYLTPEPVADRAANTVEDLAPYVEEAVGSDDYTDEGVAVEHFDAAPSYNETPSFENGSAMHADGFYEADVPPAEATTQRLDQHLPEHSDGFACPFCSSVNDPLPFVCTTCHSVLTLSDIESLLSNTGVDREVVQRAVTQMEAEWNLRDFGERELIDLGIGAFNLGNSASGFRYLQEASRLNPNNVILAGQVNAIAIRMEEIDRQAEANDLLPKGKTIMVVDDSATVRKLISGKLEKSGHNVVCAVDGVDALERLAEVLPDLVLLDITMPRMDGYEVCKQIRANPVAKNVPVVMISGKDGFFDKVRGRMAGTSGYVTKPFGPETLMKALETYLLPVVDGEEVQADVEVEVVA